MPQIVCRLVSFGVRAMHIASGRWAVTVYTSIPVDRVHAWDIASQIEDVHMGAGLGKNKKTSCAGRRFYQDAQTTTVRYIELVPPLADMVIT